MNAVEIEQAITELAEQAFDPSEFPFAFLTAFGNKPPTIKRLRSGTSNKSDVGGVLQTNNIHMKVAARGMVATVLQELRGSSATQNKRHKVRFLLATDGDQFEAEDLTTGETVACNYRDFPDHFGFFLPLAGISTVKQIRDSAFDIRATSRLNRLYVTLLQDNPDWSDEARRHDMNHFMARLIFCFFAEDTNIFAEDDLFTSTIAQMSERDSGNTHEVISKIFQAMDTPIADREGADLPRWAAKFPYVNGGLFAGNTDAPHFSRIAQRYLLHIGNLDWTQINPDIFGSMIQAVADEEERSKLGMHYTSVPNILRVLNPLFLDDLRKHVDLAGNSPVKLLNLRKRMSNIRVFDPACGSGNFLVIAYKQMREIEAEINKRRGEEGRESDISIQNFRGIELRDFSAEIARLALIIAEYQADVMFRGPKVARDTFLPLDAKNWITCGNALRLDWLDVCPPTGKSVKLTSEDLFDIPLDQAEIDFENEGGETYICGNPPYVGRKYQSPEQKSELKHVFRGRAKDILALDYVSGWFMKAADYMAVTETDTAFVSTNSICQGVQVSGLWPTLFSEGVSISFAFRSFKWSNLASHNAGVTVSIIGLTKSKGLRRLFLDDGDQGIAMREVGNINAYLVAADNVFAKPINKVRDNRTPMQFGNHPYYANALILTPGEARNFVHENAKSASFVRPLYGSKEFISGTPRYCIWIEDDRLDEARSLPDIANRMDKVREARLSKTKDGQALKLADHPHRFRDQHSAKNGMLVVPIVSSENREYLPVGVASPEAIVHNKAFALYDAPLWNMAMIASRIHWVWIGTVCVRMRTDFSYSNTLGWNTFPVPKLTEKNKADLTRCAEDILLAREAHFPATIADLYAPDAMPDDLRSAHDRNDETLERIYIGRRFKNDTERLEKLFELYTKMTTKVIF